MVDYRSVYLILFGCRVITCDSIYVIYCNQTHFDYQVLNCAKRFGPVDLQFSLSWFDLKTLLVWLEYTIELFQISAGWFFLISAGLEVQSVYRVCDVTIRKGLAVPVIMNEDDPWQPRFTKQPEIGSKINGYVLLDCFGDAACRVLLFHPGTTSPAKSTPFLMSSGMTNKPLWVC